MKYGELEKLVYLELQIEKKKNNITKFLLLRVGFIYYYYYTTTTTIHNDEKLSLSGKYINLQTNYYYIFKIRLTIIRIFFLSFIIKSRIVTLIIKLLLMMMMRLL